MTSENPVPEKPDQLDSRQEVQLEQIVTNASAAISTSTTVAVTGKSQALRDIRRQLQESELASPGVMKLLIEMLERAESECEIAEGYRDRFHDADKRAAVLQEKARTQTGLEVLYGVGLAMGGAMIGLAPTLWDGSFKGPLILVFGLVLMGGSVVARVIKG